MNEGIAREPQMPIATIPPGASMDMAPSGVPMVPTGDAFSYASDSNPCGRAAAEWEWL